jgi:ribosomal protein S12 methylthiotransferase
MKFYIKKLGCPKNDVDADYIAGELISAGHEPVDDPDMAEAVIVNTCGFILPAKEESIETILQFEHDKLNGKLDKLIVTGCLSQRYQYDLIRELPQIDAVLGLGQHARLVDILNNNSSSGDHNNTSSEHLKYIVGRHRRVADALPYAYLKISDGCDRFCSYCAIPFIRGRFRSRSVEDIMAEAEMLVDRGKKELILVSQEGTAFGRDRGYGENILTLLKRLENIEKLEWIRLMYLHPESVTDELIDHMSASKKVLGYFDIPLQHINDRILQSINRPYTRHEVEKIINKIRTGSLENTIRTTFITGLPGETEEEFNELLEFVEDVKFDRLGAFGYSCEEGTAAADFKDQIPDETIAERQDLLMSLQQEIAFKKNIALIGARQKVIIDRVTSKDKALGRTRGDCPDIDQMVYVTGENLAVGDIVDVRVNMADGYDLLAEVAKE